MRCFMLGQGGRFGANVLAAGLRVDDRSGAPPGCLCGLGAVRAGFGGGGLRFFGGGGDEFFFFAVDHQGQPFVCLGATVNRLADLLAHGFGLGCHRFLGRGGMGVCCGLARRRQGGRQGHDQA